MLGLGFGVRHIPATLPDIVFALFSGLNAAAVGLITLAAYNLSAKVITDPLTRIEVLISAAFGSCFSSQWLYPVLMVAGALATLVWDMWEAWKVKRKVQTPQPDETDHVPQPAIDSAAAPTSQNIHVVEDIEMDNISRPDPVAVPSSRIETHSMEKVRSKEENPSALFHRRSVAQSNPTDHQIDAEDAPLEQWQYFSLNVKGGLCM